MDGAEARAAIAFIRRRADEYEDSANYRAWPGPNSNSFVDRIGRDCPELAFELEHNAAGKDYALRAGPTTTGTGLELESPVLGIQLGLREGVEVHFLQLTWGVSLFPPALKLPLLPRLGWRRSPA